MSDGEVFSAPGLALTYPVVPIYHRFRKAILPLRRFFLGDRYLARVGNHRMVVNLADRGFTQRFFYRREHEPAETAVLRRLVRPGMTVIDVGANIGLHTVELSELVGAGGRVFAFEPDPSNRGLLEENIALNGCPNVTVVGAALGDRDGELVLFQSKYNQGDHRTYSGEADPRFHRGGDRTEVRVPCRRLDSFAAEHDLDIDFLKVDIQGAEARLWEGMAEVVSRRQQLRMVSEFWPDGIRFCGDNPVELLGAMTEAGFLIHTVEAGQLTPVAPSDLLGQIPANKHVNVVLSRTSLD